MSASGKGRYAELARGWPLLLAAALGSLPMAIPPYATGVFLASWEAEFGWSRAQIASAISIYTLVLALSSPLVGLINDRFGVKWPTLISIALVPVGLLMISQVGPQIWTLYAAYLLYSVMGSLSSAVPFSRLIVQHFHKSRGLALGLGQCGAPLSILTLPALAYLLIQHVEWRTAWLGMGILSVIIAPIVFAGLRSAERLPGHGSATGASATYGMTAGAALRTSRFWILLSSFTLLMLASAGAVSQLVPILQSKGISTGQAVTLQAVLAISVGVSRILAGYIIDRVFAVHVCIGLCLIGAVSFATLTLGYPPLIIVAVIGIGMVVGAEVDILGFMISKYFGLRSYGQLFGLLFGALLVGNALSHPLYGLLYDINGDYLAATAFSAFAALLVAFVLQRMGPYPTFEDMDEGAEPAQDAGPPTAPSDLKPQ